MWHVMGDTGQALRGACLVDKTETCFAIPCSLRSWLACQPHSELYFEENLCLILGSCVSRRLGEGRKPVLGL